MLGGFLALLSAIAFGLNNASVRRGVLQGSVLQAMAITVPLGVPFFLVLILFSGKLSVLTQLSLPAFVWLSAAGVLHFVIGRYCNYRSTKCIGGNLSGPWRQSNLILALVLAVVLLDEVLTPLKMLGIALIVLGATLTSRATFKPPTETAPSDATPTFEPRYAEGYLFALLSAVAYGVSPIMIRIGLENQGPATGLVGGLVSYCAAALVVGLMLLLPGRWQHVRQAGSTSVRWFSLAAILVACSQMFRYVALSIAPVSVVTPIQSTSAVFRVIFGWLINRHTEAFGAWVVVGALVSMLGVLCLSVTIDLVASILPLPESLHSLIESTWPD